VKEPVLPVPSRVSVFGVKLIPTRGIGSDTTVTAHSAVTAVFAVDAAVTLAVPTLSAVTVPPETVATAGALLDQVMPFSVVFGGTYVTVRVIVLVPFSAKLTPVSLRTIAVGGTGADTTVTAHSARMALFTADAAVTLAFPTPSAVTVPPETAATAGLSLAQIISLSVVSAGAYVTVSTPVFVPFRAKFQPDVFRPIPVRGTVDGPLSGLPQAPKNARAQISAIPMYRGFL
jgi:hypothetical protein